MKRKISKFTARAIGVIMGTAVLLSQPQYNMVMDITEVIATTTAGDDLAEEGTVTEQPADTTVDASNVSMEDTKITDTIYINYGEGGIFVNVIKDIDSSEESADSTDEGSADVDNGQEEQMGVTPEVTEEAQEEDVSATQSSTVQSLMNHTFICSSVELVNACLSEEEKTEVMAGGTKELRVTFHVATEDELKQSQLEEIGIAMDDYMLATTGLSFCNYLQITVEKKNAETGKWKKMKDFETPVEVSVDILPEFRNTAGTFQILVPNGNVYDLLDDEDIYEETITFSMRGTGVYALCYQSEIVENETTPAPTAKPSFIGKLVTSDLCLWHWFMCAFFIIGLTWVAAINAKKKRVVFMIVMDVILLICAVLGRCLYCWCFLVAFIIILFLIHVWKTKRMASIRK